MALKAIRPVKAKPSVKRKFYYYSIETRHIDKTTNIANPCNDPSQSLIKVFEGFKNLKYSNNIFTERYIFHQNRDGNYIYVTVDEVNKKYIKFQLLLCRDNLFPYIEENGKLTPLSTLLSGGNKKLAEVSHGIIFLESNILALEYNFAGAKRNDLAEYIDAKSNYFVATNFPNLLNIDALKKLKASNEMSLFKIRVLSNSAVIGMLTQADSSFGALKCMKENVDYVELVLRRRTTKNKPGFTIPILNKEFVGKIFKLYKDDFDSLKIRYESGTEEIDLLSDQFVCNKPFVPIEKTKTILAAEAYNTMITFYDDSVRIFVVKD